MGRKNDKRTRRAVAFYKVHYGFREPYKVLLDGNFIHATQQVKHQAPQEALEKLLGATCKAFTTKCVSLELKGLGDDYRDSFQTAKRQQLHKCGHEQPISAADCILQQIGKGNGDHWWVATQDSVLRQALAKLPGVPCVTATVHGLHLDAPSEQVKEGIKQAQLEQLAVPEHELAAGRRRAQGPLRGKGVFQRNKAKGPNPLAVQKKKPLKVKGGGRQQQGQQQGGGAGAGAGGDTEGAAAAAAKKKRRRHKQKAGGAAAGAGEADGGGS